jgi:putative peptidoglycan lipid II flippase
MLAAIVAVRWGTPAGSLLLFTQAQTVYLLPWAVFAVPLATSAYPVLARAYAQRDEPGYRATLAGSGRGVLVLCGLGAAGLVAVAGPVSRVLGVVARHQVTADLHTLALTIAAFAPGLFGYGLYALHSRALYARGENRAAARATLLGWGLATALSVLLAVLAPTDLRVPAVAAGNSAGMLVLGVLLVRLIAARAGVAAVAGVWRAGAVSVFAGTVAAVAGVGVGWLLPSTPGLAGSLWQGMLTGVVATLAFGVVAGVLAREQVTPLLRRGLRLARRVAGGRVGREPAGERLEEHGRSQ